MFLTIIQVILCSHCIWLTYARKLQLSQSNLRLPTSPHGPCVTLWRLFGNKKYCSVFLKSNYPQNIWVLRKKTGRKVEIPVRFINYYEFCTFTVFADTSFPNKKIVDWDYLKLLTIRFSQYSLFLRGQYSMYVILRIKCGHPKFTSKIGNSASLIVYYINCDTPAIHNSFTGSSQFVLVQRLQQFVRYPAESFSIYSATETSRPKVNIGFPLTKVVKNTHNCKNYKS